MTSTAATISQDPHLNLSGRVPELDGIRGVAIGMVILWHLYFVSGAAPGSLSYYLHFTGRLFWSGVDLFFVLSGFLIGGILLDNRGANNYFRVFYTRRLFRIVPAYMVSLLFFYVLARLMQSGAAPRLNFLKTFQLLPWAPHLFFLQNFWMAASNTAGILVVTWSLCIEEQFYLTLPLLVRFLSPKRLLAFVACAIVSAPMFRIALLLFWHGHRLANYVLLPARADALMLGVLGAIAVRHPPSKTWLLSHRPTLRFLIAIFSFGYLALLFFSYGYDARGIQTAGYTWLALLYVSLLLYALTNPASGLSAFLRWRPLRHLGELAYGLYLYHTLVIWVLFGVLYSTWPSITNLKHTGVALIALAIMFLMAKASWVYFEEPLVQFGHRTKYQFRSPARFPGLAPWEVEGNP